MPRSAGAGGEPDSVHAYPRRFLALGDNVEVHVAGEHLGRSLGRRALGRFMHGRFLICLMGNQFQGRRPRGRAGDRPDRSGVAAILALIGGVEFVVDVSSVDEIDVSHRVAGRDLPAVAQYHAAVPCRLGPVHRSGVEVVAKAHHPHDDRRTQRIVAAHAGDPYLLRVAEADEIGIGPGRHGLPPQGRIRTLSDSRSAMALYPSGTSSSPTVRSKTRPGSTVPSRMSGISSSMYARAGAAPPVNVTFRNTVSNPSGPSVYCGTPMRLIAPPARAIFTAVSMDGSVPTHSSTACVPSPRVSSRTRSTPSSPRAATTSVAPNSRPRSVRSVCLPIRMICSAPSRLAASTPHSPTAPWWPVQYTSDRVRSDGISAESGATGSLTSVPWASGTRTASPC